VPEPQGQGSTSAKPAVRGAGGRTTINSRSYIRARILWPALGFPEVVAPKPDDAAISCGNGTNCIHVLLLAERDKLDAADVAFHLRYAPWDQRRTRYLKADSQNNSFSPDFIEVQSVQPVRKDDLVEQVTYASGYITAGLSKYVVDFYQKQGLKFLHQVRVFESASAKLGPGLYNLFWINRKDSDTSQQRSAEMNLLIEKFAADRRRSDRPAPPPQIYEFEFGYVSLRNNGKNTYDAMGKSGYLDHRTEVLHPLIVRDVPNRIRIGHMADTHCSTHLDIYEMSLSEAGVPSVEAQQFNNWNQRFREFHRRAAGNCDLVIIAGDIIDYGRGHIGMQIPLDKIEAYWYDLNWIQFCTMLSSGYSKPVFTILGNHDWRLQPYAPFAPGAPHFSSYNLCSADQLKKVHAAGHEGAFTYGALTENPLWTDVESVAWYLLLINPFLDYTVRFPGGYSLLMLDWAQTEEIWEGQQNAPMPILGIGLPVAKHSLTDLQKSLVEWFLSSRDKALGIALHATLIGPPGGWSRKELYRGWLKFDPNASLKDVPTTTVTVTGPDGAVQERYRFVPIRAVNDPPEEKSRIPPCYETTHGTIRLHRDWLIYKLQQANVSMVLSGHIHRNMVFRALRQKRPGSFTEHELPKGTAMALRPDQLTSEGLRRIAGWEYRPLFINSTSAGPIGSDRDEPPPKDGKCLLPGYSEVVLARNGDVEAIDFLQSEEIELQWAGKYSKT